MFSGRGRLALLEPPQIDSASLKKSIASCLKVFLSCTPMPCLQPAPAAPTSKWPISEAFYLA